MILRRIAEAIRRQNWFVVLVEILIVVLGVFIGLQVDDWNQNRIEMARQSEILDRLYSELEEVKLEVDRTVDFLKSARDAVEVVVYSLQEGQLAPGDRGDFERGLHILDVVDGVAWSMGTVDEILGSQGG